MLLDQGHRLGRVELARNHQHAIIGLVILAIELLQLVDRHALDVGAVADRRFAVVVPVEGRGHDPLVEQVAGGVFAALELVAHDRHFREQIFLLDEAVDEAVGFQVEREVEVVLAGRQGLEVVRAVDPRAAVEAGAALLQRLGNQRVRRRALEHHVLEQVGHARLAVAFMARAHQHRQVDRHRRLRIVGIQQHQQAVVEPVFRDAFDRLHLGRRGMGRRGRDGERKTHDRQNAIGGQPDT